MRTFIPLLSLLFAFQATAQEAWLTEARKVALSVPPKLLQVLTDEIAKGGPASAVEVCSDKAPKMARAASEETGWNIRRVSLRNRHPKAVPDAWESAALEEFDRRAAAGESAATLEKWTSTMNGERIETRYIRALPVQQICLACHGSPETIAPEVRTQLQLRYPHDKATGYSIGQIRGAMTIRKAQ